MHVTLIFFGNVSGDEKSDLAAMTGRILWIPMPVRLGGLALFGKNALSAALEADPEDRDDLRIMLGLTAPPRLHLSLARVRKGANLKIGRLTPPALDLSLDRLVLFESVHRPVGVEYEVVAEAQS